MTENAAQRGRDGVLVGTWYPENYLVAVIDGLGAAERAVSALMECGCSRSDIQLLRAEEVIAAAEQMERQQKGNFFKSLVAAFQRATSEEGAAAAGYREQAAAGRHILLVETHRADEVPRYRPILDEHGAHDLRVYGRWGITDIP